MALFYELPVFQDAYRLVLLLFQYTTNFPREYKFTLGQDMKHDGLIPEPNSQYWIAPGIQHYFDAYVSKMHPELVKYLKENNPEGMIYEN